ncbi:MAG: acetate kinase [Candidatus Muiribacterium halophilum]|uniref:Acetate kinase n=1 Tax=Muiribacterium halophilum TaxID=2053465 RepID=A0A2N5ZGR3_MUIH1|nr:MAG: acetate kinase [Candidatus Muirbacterium halophilum]
MKILVLNCGSSSVKYQLRDGEVVLAKGLVERIGKDDAIFKYKTEKNNDKDILPMKDHDRAISHILEVLVDKDRGVLENLHSINAVGHRLVHGGEKFSSSVYVTDEVLDTIKECINLAPLHNPHNIKGVEACAKLLKDVPQAGVFDTAFHHTMEPHAYLYALPYELYEKYKIRRYGFHGTSHMFVAQQAAEFVGKDIKDLKIITCHLGNGSSIAAVKNGRSVDTSMGFTPLEGLVMGTRSGDIDPAIFGYLQEYCDYSEADVNNMLNKKSGVLGISEMSNDMREIEEGFENKNERCILTYKIMAHRLKKYIGAYASVMNGVDIIVFTGGVGENDYIVRRLTLSDMDYLGVDYSEENNMKFLYGKKGEITKASSKVKALCLPTDEEYVIACETETIIKNLT